MTRLLLLSILILTVTEGNAQLTIQNGKHILEISGGISTYYNYRPLKEGETDRSKDRFKLRDAQIDLEGRVGTDFEYEIQVDLADLASNDFNVQIDPENPGLMDANITYKGFGFIDLQMGYGKVYYSRSSLVPFDSSPYWQRPEISRGSIFSSRDVGITLMKNFWKQRANIYLGAYTGLGELSLNGDNDPSGNPEFIGRVDVSYPARYRYREIDDRQTPIPMFSIGINGRFANKKLPDGEVFPDNASGEYGLKVIDGKKYTYGFDVSAQYMGISAQFEMHQIKSEPQSPTDVLLQNLTEAQTGGYVLSGGYIAELSYFFKPARLILSGRYEQLDLNDLVPGRSERFSGAIAYQIHGYNAMIKGQYFNIMEEESIDPLKWNEQFRLGLVFQIK